MTARRRIAALAALSVLMAGIVGGAVLVSLYHAALDREAAALLETVESQARLAESVFRHELDFHQAGDSARARDGVLAQLAGGLQSFRGFGRTGEFTVTRVHGDTLYYEVGLQGDSARMPDPIPLPSPLGEPAQRAARGETGIARAPDYRGVSVLAAHTPITGTDLGLVAKMDLSEVRAPYLRAALQAALVIGLLVAAILLLAFPISRLLLKEVEERESAHRAFLEHFPGIAFHAVLDAEAGWRFDVFEGAAEEITGFPAAHFRGSAVTWAALTPDEDRAALAERWTGYASGDVTDSTVEHRVRRRDGSLGWVRAIARAEPGEVGARGVTGVIYDITEQRRRDEELASTEARFHAFMDASPAVAWIKDAGGRHLWVNPAWERAFGLSREDWQGKTEYDLVPGPLAEVAHRADEEVIRTGKPVIAVEDTGDLGGVRRLWQTSKFPLRGASGEALVGGIAVDITREHASEEALRKNERLLGLALKAGGHGLYDVDLRTGRASVNAEYALMLGHDPATFDEGNDAWRDRLHPDDRERAFAEFEAYLRGERDAYRQEFRLRCADGTWRWILSVGEIVERDAAGNPVRMVGTHTDIQAPKDAEAALGESEDRFRRAVESSPEAIFIQTEGRFAYLNPAARTLFGVRDAAELVGTPVLDRFVPRDREAVALRIRRLNEQRLAVENQAETVLQADGTELQAEFSAVPFRYQGSDGALVFARDVSERAAAEERLHANLEELRRWQAVMLDREDRVQELKREVNELCVRARLEPRYPSQQGESGGTRSS